MGHGATVEVTEVRAALGLVEAYLEAERAHRRIPGLSAGVVADQELIWARGFGEARPDVELPAAPDTLFRVGSITKLFTATMLMQLRDAGTLDLDDGLAAHWPGLALKAHPASTRPPTFRQLVSHTGGLPREAPFDHWQTLDFPSAEVILNSLATVEPVYPPLTAFKYSNLGVAVLGHVLARIAGQPYEAYIDERIFRPLGMRSSAFDLTPELAPRLATGHEPARDDTPPRPSPHPHLNGFTPAGQLYSTVEDMARFIALQFRDGPAGGAQILAGDTLREMHQPVMMLPDWQGGTAIGWRLARSGGSVTIGHGGGVPGFTTQITLVPTLKLGLIVFTNTGTDPLALARTALDLLIPPFSRLEARQSAAHLAPVPAVWWRYCGRYSMGGVVDLDVQVVGGRLLAADPKAPPGGEAVFVHERDHTFRVTGGAVDGETATFALDDGGTVTGLRYGPYPLARL